jgi:hypothetical protein
MKINYLNNNRYKDNQSNLNTKSGVSTPKSGKLLNSKGSESNLNNIKSNSV